MRFQQKCVHSFVQCECTVVSLGDDSTKGSSVSIFTAVVKYVWLLHIMNTECMEGPREVERR